MNRFRRLAIATLGFTLLVILWGAFVRASGSGAGCGSHWPLCNGEVVPRPKSLATVVELTHRVTSGLAFLLMVAQLVWAMRSYPQRHATRRAAIAAMTFMVIEALVGAGLVLFEMVAENRSIGRAYWMAAHLVNTFALIGAQGLVVLLAARGPQPVAWAPERRALGGVGVVMLGVLLVGVTGAIAALGDTLYPAASLAEGMRADLSPSAHAFVRLRVWHPVLAVTVGLGTLFLAGVLASRGRPGLRPLATTLAFFVLAQIGAGIVNLVLLAPIPMQLVHLLLADGLWLTLVAVGVNLAFAPAGHAAATTSPVRAEALAAPP